MVFMTSTVVLAGDITLQQAQVNCIQMAYDEGEKINLYGDTWGQTAASIAFQESHCNHSAFRSGGVVVGDLNSEGRPRSLGVMQMQLKTARYVNSKFPYLFKERYGNRIPSDEELTIDLLIDNRFAIRLGVYYFAYLLERKDGKWGDAILAYNRGPTNTVDVNDYVRKVKDWRLIRIIPYLKGNYKVKG